MSIRIYLFKKKVYTSDSVVKRCWKNLKASTWFPINRIIDEINDSDNKLKCGKSVSNR